MADKTALDYLASIDASLKALLAALKPEKPVRVDLDGPHGDPVVRAKDPRDWNGPSMIGRKFSECPPEYLDLLADRFLYFAEKADATNELTAGGIPKSKYNREDAGKARGWALRMRSGEHTPPPAEEPETDGRW